jgi:hypothetical protein
MKKVAISQSNYIPWKGYFDNIAFVDEFILYDDMQYTKRDWRNRNKIKTKHGLKWLSVPVEVKGKYFQKIKDTRIADKNWNINHLKIILQSYKNAPCFSEVKDFIGDIYNQCNFDNLSEVNYHFLTKIASYIGFNPKISWSSEFDLKEDRNERLVSICKDLNATEYYSGEAARFYLDNQLFKDNDIKVNWYENDGYKEYQQINGDFNHYVSIIDLLFHQGVNSKNYLKHV